MVPTSAICGSSRSSRLDVLLRSATHMDGANKPGSASTSGHEDANRCDDDEAMSVARGLWNISQIEAFGHSAAEAYMGYVSRLRGVDELGGRQMSLVTEENADIWVPEATAFGLQSRSYPGNNISPHQRSSEEIDREHEVKCEGVNCVSLGINIAPRRARQVPVFKLMICAVLIGFVCGALPFTYINILHTYYRMSENVANRYLASRAHVLLRCRSTANFISNTYYNIVNTIEGTCTIVYASIANFYTGIGRKYQHIVANVQKFGFNFRQGAHLHYLNFHQDTLQRFETIRRTAFDIYNFGHSYFIHGYLEINRLYYTFQNSYFITYIVQLAQRIIALARTNVLDDEEETSPAEAVGEPGAPERKHQVIPYSKPQRRTRALCISIPYQMDIIAIFTNKLLRSVQRAALITQRSISRIIVQIDRIANLN